jgi:hypothetical protein
VVVRGHHSHSHRSLTGSQSGCILLCNAGSVMQERRQDRWQLLRSMAAPAALILAQKGQKPAPESLPLIHAAENRGLLSWRLTSAIGPLRAKPAPHPLCTKAARDPVRDVTAHLI